MAAGLCYQLPRLFRQLPVHLSYFTHATSLFSLTGVARCRPVARTYSTTYVRTSEAPGKIIK